MPEPRWLDVDTKGNCSHCAGVHYGTGLECPYREKNMGEPCVVCAERTSYCCSDCAIDGAGKVYVCIKDACRTEHEKKHPNVSPASFIIDDAMITRALARFDTGVGDPNDYRKRMRAALEAALSF